MAEREGFEPSMELLTPYSLSRGAPSAARPPLRLNWNFRFGTFIPNPASQSFLIPDSIDLEFLYD